MQSNCQCSTFKGLVQQFARPIRYCEHTVLGAFCGNCYFAASSPNSSRDCLHQTATLQQLAESKLNAMRSVKSLQTHQTAFTYHKLATTSPINCCNLRRVTNSLRASGSHNLPRSATKTGLEQFRLNFLKAKTVNKEACTSKVLKVQLCAKHLFPDRKQKVWII